MGMRRRSNKHLPRRMYIRQGKYYLVEPSGRWVPLGAEYAKAMAKYGELTDVQRLCVTLGDVIDRYRIDVLPKKAESTRRNESPQLNRLKVFCGHLRPRELTTQEVYQYMDGRAKQSPTAANQEATLLHHVFKKAIRWGAASNNPVSGIEKVKVEPRKKRKVTDEEFLAVWLLATPSMRVAMDLALLTGLRRGDLLSLTRDNLTDEGIFLKIGKTGRELLIRYSPALETVLKESKKLKPQVPGRYLIRNRKGGRYTEDGFATNWQRLMRKAVKQGVPRFAFKDIRKKCATDKAKKESLQSASQLMAHSSVEVTKKFYITDVPEATPLK